MKVILRDKKRTAIEDAKFLGWSVASILFGFFLHILFHNIQIIDLIAVVFLGIGIISSFLGFMKVTWSNCEYFALKLKSKRSNIFQYFIIIIYPIILSLYFLVGVNEFKFNLFFADLIKILWFDILIYFGLTWFFLNVQFDNKFFFKAFLTASVIMFFITMGSKYGVPGGGGEDYDPEPPSEEQIKMMEFRLEYGLYSAVYLQRIILSYLAIFAFSFFKKRKLGKK